VDTSIVVLNTAFIWNGWLHSPNFTGAKKSSMKKAFITDTIAALFILLFVYAATSKLLDYDNFQIQLSQSPLLAPFAHSFSWIVPLIELLIAVMLTINRLRLTGMYAAYNLMILFTAYIIAVTRFSKYVPCSCGGILQKLSWNQHLAFNIFFVIISITAILLYNKHDQTNYSPL